jgi:hypothetical protein
MVLFHLLVYITECLAHYGASDVKVLFVRGVAHQGFHTQAAA